MNKLLLERIETLSLNEIYKEMYLDPLTNILNRRAFDIIEKTKFYLYVAIIDLDGLKYVNDVLGHREGDKELYKLAKKLEDIDEKVFRLSGDEFVILSVKHHYEDLSYFLEEKRKYKDNFSYGVAEDLQTADLQLRLDKSIRESESKRAHRGECPPWLKNRKET